MFGLRLDPLGFSMVYHYWVVCIFSFSLHIAILDSDVN